MPLRPLEVKSEEEPRTDNDKSSNPCKKFFSICWNFYLGNFVSTRLSCISIFLFFFLHSHVVLSSNKHNYTYSVCMYVCVLSCHV